MTKGSRMQSVFSEAGYRRTSCCLYYLSPAAGCAATACSRLSPMSAER